MINLARVGRQRCWSPKMPDWEGCSTNVATKPTSEIRIRQRNIRKNFCKNLFWLLTVRRSMSKPLKVSLRVHTVIFVKGKLSTIQWVSLVSGTCYSIDSTFFFLTSLKLPLNFEKSDQFLFFLFRTHCPIDTSMKFAVSKTRKLGGVCSRINREGKRWFYSYWKSENRW